MTARVRVEATGSPGAELPLHPTEAHHAVNVRRLREGMGLVVLDGLGARWSATLIRAEPAVVRLEGTIDGFEADPDVDVEFWLPLLKGGRTDGLVRQLTELGVSSLVIYQSASGVARLASDRVASRLARWTTIAAEATKQCGRGELPEVHHSSSPPGPGEGPGVFFRAQPGPLWRTVRQEGVSATRVLVGPEGGLSVDEGSRLTAQGWTSAWLGPRVLRAETAVVAATVLALQALEEGGY